LIDPPAIGLAAQRTTSMAGKSLMQILEGKPETAINDYIFGRTHPGNDNWEPGRLVISKKYMLIQNFRPSSTTAYRLSGPTPPAFQRYRTVSRLAG